jgi:hypothetical protein
MSDVEARAETDLEHAAGKRSSDADPDWRELAAAHD